MTTDRERVRHAVRRHLVASGFGGSPAWGSVGGWAQVDSDLVLVACSGGPDSLALAVATAAVALPRDIAAGAVVVDHQLQDDSATVAQRAAAQCRELGLAPVIVAPARAGAEGNGPEDAARRARYATLESCARQVGAREVLLGHTQDDQAETVLLGLARGGGPRALAGMAARRGVYGRPLLGLPRAVVRGALGDLDAHDDAHNTDSRFARTRVRHEVLPFLEDALGPGVVPALARSADLIRQETQAVDEVAAAVAQRAIVAGAVPKPDGPASPTGEGTVRVLVDELADQSRAVVVRVMRIAAAAAVADGGRITRVHLDALAALVVNWRGQGVVHLPGGVSAARESGTVVFRTGSNLSS